jgi:hypothetical protein
VFVRDSFNQSKQRKTTHRLRLGAALLCALTLAVAARTAAATPAAPTLTSSADIVCDTAATPAAPRKAATARPRKAPKPRVAPLAVAAPAAPKRKPTKTVAVAHARKRRPSTATAAGHRAPAPAAAARTSPPRCRSSAVVAATPDVVAVQNLVSSLPWTAPAPEADLAFPVATAPTLAELGGIDLRSGTALAAGLLGAGAFWIKSGGDDAESRAVIPNEPGGPSGPGGPGGPGDDSPPITTVPEPATLALVASGLAAIGARSRRRKAR